jgi:hypothetical protein
MANFIDIVILPFILILMCGLLSMPYFMYKSAERKDGLYEECITTDYDKFQCYAMIYGDK